MNDIVEVIKEVRGCFNRLKTLGDQLHKDKGITSSMRAVMESLFNEGMQTVPQIARSKSVTRQHIQTLVNKLLKKDLVEIKPNPFDARTYLVALTPSGKKQFTLIMKDEAWALKNLSKHLDSSDLGATSDSLKLLSGAIDELISKSSK